MSTRHLLRLLGRSGLWPHTHQLSWQLVKLLLNPLHPVLQHPAILNVPQDNRLQWINLVPYPFLLLHLLGLVQSVQRYDALMYQLQCPLRVFSVLINVVLVSFNRTDCLLRVWG